MRPKTSLRTLAPYIDFATHFDAVNRCKEIRAGRVIKRRLHHGHGEAGRSRTQIEDNHRTGCAAEVAFRLWLGVNPHPDNETWKKADVLNIEVRGTFAKNGHLIVYDQDKDDQLAVLVILAESGGAIIRGWMPMSQAKTYPGHTPRGRDYTQNHWVPAQDLNPMCDIPIAVPVRYTPKNSTSP